jgi:hypothetical protein
LAVALVAVMLLDNMTALLAALVAVEVDLVHHQQVVQVLPVKEMQEEIKLALVQVQVEAVQVQQVQVLMLVLEQHHL